MSRARAAATLTVAALASARVAVASCGQAFCSVDPHLNVPAAPVSRELRLDTSLEYIEQDQPWVRHHGADVGAILREDHNEVETTNLTWRLAAEVGISGRWSLGVHLPVVHREHLHLAADGHSTAAAAARRGSGALHDEEEQDGEDGHDDRITIGNATGVPERWEFTRLGDIQVVGSFAALRPDDTFGTSLRVYAGLELPSGDTGVRNSEGERAEMTLQPGSGSVDPVLGLALHHPLRIAETLVPLSAGAALRSEGSDGRHGYRPGTELILSAAAEYPLFDRLDLLGQLNFRYRDRDHAGAAPGVDAEHTGGEALFLSPGVRVALTDALRTHAYVQVPVYQRVNGIQLVSEWNLLAGLTYQLDL